MMEKQIMELNKRYARKKMLKRIVALLCVFVMLFTVNSLKMVAQTLTRKPMCGLKEHLHKAECYDSAGNLICGKVEHQHTDACYQESPTLEIEDDSAIGVNDDLALDAGGLSLDLDAGALDLNDDLVTEDVAAPVANEAPVTPTYVLGSKALLSNIIENTGLNIKIKKIKEVGIVDNDGSQVGLVEITKKDNGDYRIKALRDFDQVELAIVLADEVVVVKLLDGVAPAEPVVEEPAAPQVEEAQPAPAVEVEQPEQPAPADESEQPELTVPETEDEQIELAEQPEPAVTEEQADLNVEDAQVEQEEVPAAEEMQIEEPAVEEAQVETPVMEAVEPEQPEAPAVVEEVEPEQPEAPAQEEEAEPTEAPAEEEAAEPEPTEAPVVEEPAEPEQIETPVAEEEPTEVATTEEEPTEVPAGEEPVEASVDEEAVPQQTEASALAGEIEAPAVEEAAAPELADADLTVDVPADGAVATEPTEPEQTVSVEEPEVQIEETAAEETAAEEIATEETATEEKAAEEIASIEEAVEPAPADAQAEQEDATEEPAPADEQAEQDATEEPAPAEEQAEQGDAAEEPAPADEQAEREDATEEPAPAEEQAEQGDATEDEAAEPALAEAQAPQEDGEKAVEIEGEEAAQEEIDQLPVDAETADGEAGEPEQDEAAVYTAGSREIPVNDAVVTLTWPVEAKIPEDVVITIEEIEKGTEDYDLLYHQALAELPEPDQAVTQVMRFFDITLYTADGQKIEPKAPVSVVVSVNETIDSEVSALHCEEVGAPMETVDANAEGESVAFDAPSFSVYGVNYQVPAEKSTVNSEVSVDLSRVDTMGAATVDGMSVSLSVADLLAGTDDAVESTVDSTVDAEQFVAEATVSSADVTVQDGTITLPADALDKATVQLSVETKETGKDYITTVTTHTVDIVLSDYAGRTEEATGEGVTVKAVGENSLPADAQASVVENVAVPESVEVGENESATAFDINLTNSNGDTISGPVAVTVMPSDLNVLSEVPEGAVAKNVVYTLVHVHDDGTVENVELPADAVVVDETGRVESFSFETESFSMYVLKYTVDFEYTDPETGAVHKYSALGKDTYKLSDVLAEIGITGELSSAELEIVSGEDLPGALFLTVIDGEYYISSGRAFTDEYKLTVIVDGVTYVITITDAAEYVTNIADLLTSAVITVDGQKVTGETWKVRAEQEYQISLRFKETAAKQFSDTQEMVFNLPDGFVLTGLENGNTSTTFDVVVDGVTVSGNTIEIKTDSNGKSYLAINWNKNDPHYDNLTSAGTTSIVVDIWGTFEAGTETVTFSDTVENEVEVDNRSNVSIQKTGYYDAEKKKIHYAVTATSVGESTNVVVTDAISGTAVKMGSDDTISMTRTPKNGSATTSDVSSAKNSNGKGFSYNIGTMTNGETVTFEYTATVDPSLIAKSGQATFDETGNTVTVTANNDGDPQDDTSSHFESWITFNSTISKNSVAIGELQEIVQTDGTKKYYKTVTWKINLNPEKEVSMYGSDLTDSIVDWVRSKMSYTGDGIRISVDGGTSQTVAWSTLGVTPDTTETGIRDTSQKTWTYTFNNTSDEGVHSYVVEYDTLVEITDQTQDLTVQNTTTGKPGSDTAYGPVYKAPSQGGESGTTTPTGPAINKAVTSVNENQITWKINVVASGEGYTGYIDGEGVFHDGFVIEDLFPQQSDNHDRYDTLNSVSVSGLLPGEHYTTDTLKEEKQVWNERTHQYDITYLAKGVKLTFYKSAGDSEPGLQKNVTSMNGNEEVTSDRVLTITIVTDNNQDWMNDSEINANIGFHVNTVNVYTATGNNTATASVSPRKKKVTKYALGNGYDEAGAVHTSYDKVTIGGVQYPVYKFELLVEGTTEDTITLTDTFDTQALKVFDGHYDGETADNPYLTRSGHDLNTIMGGQNSNLSQGYTDRYPITVVETPTGAAITATLPKTTEGAYYPFYRIIYYLVPNGEDGLARLKNLAIDSDGTAILTNTASLDANSTSSTYVEYTYKPVSKTVTGPVDGKYHYTVTLNPDKKRLNNGNPLPATDTFSGMAVDYTSITVTTDPADKKAEVSWDYSGNTGTFTIPDATKVVLEYDARPVGTTSTITMTNTIELKGSTVTTNTNATVNIKGSGSAITARLYLLKYASGDMTVPLSGAVFGLYEKSGDNYAAVKYAAGANNGQEVQFTTGTNGIAEVFLDQSQDGIFIDPEFNEYDSTTGTYTLHEGKTYYLKELVAPDGYDLDETYYQFKITDIPGNVNYGTNGQYVYLNRDVLKIVNKPEAGLRIKKIVNGVEELTEDEINRISFTVTGPDSYSRTIPYSDFVNGQYKLPDATDKTAHPGWLSLPTGTYTVTETVTTADGATFTTTYKVDSARTTSTENAQTEITADDIANNRDHVITVTNTYTPAEITVIKTDKTSGTKLAGATFKLEKQQAGGSYAVFANSALSEGLFTFTEDNKDAGITIGELLDGYYRLTETVAPDGGYAALTTPVEFTVSDGTVTFTNGSSFEDGIVTLDDGTFTIANEKKQLIVKKEWVGGIPESATVYFKLLMSNDSWATNKNYQYYTSQYNYTELFTLNSSNNWTMTFEGLDASYVYRPVELKGNWLQADECIEGNVISFSGTAYTVTYSGTEFGSSGTAVITNTKVPTGIAVLKKWETDDANDIKPVTVQLMKATADYGSSPEVQVTLYGTDAEYTATKSLYVAKGADVTVFVSEWWTENGSDIKGVEKSDIEYSDGKFIVKNVQKDYNITITKSDFRSDWTGGFNLSTNSQATFTLSDSTAQGSPVILNAGNNWYNEWKNLEEGYYYYIVETAVDGIELASTAYVPTYTNNNGIKTGTITVTNSKTTPKTGSLAITKAVTNAADLAGTKTFTFNVALTHTPAVNPSTIEVTGGTMGTATTSGDTVTIPVSVTGEGTVTLSNIPVGTTYVVIEPDRSPADGWSQVGEVDYSDDTKTIAANDVDIARVTNTYSATGTVDFKARKTLVGGTLAVNQFSFELIETDSSWGNRTVLQTKPIDTSGSGISDVTFEAVPLTNTDTRYFIIKEVVPTGNDADGSIIYDTHEQKITVTVSDNGAGTLIPNKSYYPEYDETGYDASFENTKKGALKITKAVTVNGESPTDSQYRFVDGQYTFTVASGAGITPAVAKRVVITVTNGTAASATVDGVSVNLSEGYVVLTGLTPGSYTVTEETPTNGTAISKINEVASSDYNTTVTVEPNQTATVSFTNNINTTERHAKKVWDDNNNSNSNRPDSITFTLSGTYDNNGTPVNVELSSFGIVASKTADNSNEWRVDWTNLPENTLDGKAIRYAVAESAVTGYEEKQPRVFVEETGTWTVTNTEETVNIPVRKVWGAAETGAWPEEVVSVKVGLYTQVDIEADLVAVNDGNSQLMTVTLTSAEPETFSNLPKYKNGQLVTYKVQEIEVVVTTQDDGQKTYTIESTPKVTDVFTVTYGHPDADNNYNATVRNTIGGTSIKLLKVVQGTETPISGAKFTLAKKTGEAYSKVEEKGSDANGTIEFDGLEAGEYRLQETHIPTGYLRTSSGKYIYFKVDASGVTRINSGEDAIPTSDNTVVYAAANGTDPATFTVGNTPGAALPATGGPGTTLYYIAGASLLLIALAMLLLRRKRNYD